MSKRKKRGIRRAILRALVVQFVIVVICGLFCLPVDYVEPEDTVDVTFYGEIYETGSKRRNSIYFSNEKELFILRSCYRYLNRIERDELTREHEVILTVDITEKHPILDLVFPSQRAVGVRTESKVYVTPDEINAQAEVNRQQCIIFFTAVGILATIANLAVCYISVLFYLPTRKKRQENKSREKVSER